MSDTEVEEVLVIGDEDFEHNEQSEHDDYLLVRDPTSSDPDSWCVVLLGGDFNDWVVSFSDVVLNTEEKEPTVAFQYSILYPDYEVEYDQRAFVNRCSSTLSSVLVGLHESGAQSYTDLRTGEEIKLDE